MFEEIALNLDELKTLDPFDRQILVEDNFQIFFSLITAHFFNFIDFNKHMNMLIAYIQEHVTEDSVYALIVELFRQIKAKKSTLVLSYESVYTPKVPIESSQEPKQHKELLKKLTVPTHIKQGRHFL